MKYRSEYKSKTMFLSFCPVMLKGLFALGAKFEPGFVTLTAATLMAPERHKLKTHES